jgi:hypothetical protein
MVTDAVVASTIHGSRVAKPRWYRGPMDHGNQRAGGAFAGAMHTVFDPGSGPNDDQLALTDAMLGGYFLLDDRYATTVALTAEQVRRELPELWARRFLVDTLIVLEMCTHQNPGDLPDRVDEFATDLGVSDEMLVLGRDAAEGVMIRLERDWTRFREPSLASDDLLSGRVPTDLERIASCPAGSIGQGLHAFYARHGHADPGADGFGELSIVQHDFHHVVSGYGTAAQDEIALQGFLTRAERPHHFTGLVASIGLFELGAFGHIFETIDPRVHALQRPGAMAGLAEAFQRGAAVTSAFSHIDVATLVDVDVEEFRAQHGVPSRSVPPAWADGDVGF